LRTFRILFFGDVVGSPGISIFQKYARKLQQQYQANVIIVNGENAAGNGRGIVPSNVTALKHNGASVITGGNHSFQKKEIFPYYSQHKELLRPANFPPACPGTGVGLYEIDGVAYGVVNIQGQVFMKENLACPIRTLDSAITYLKSRTNIIFVDLHAETTAEKAAISWYFDGKVSAIVGTHTHIQTADERILPEGTAFITDVGMLGAYNSSIGMKKELIIHHTLTQMPVKFEVEEAEPYILNAVIIAIDAESGKAISIERIRIIDDTI
jgi:2',3'-cyclic-nucleotide 2'-phosphodiesterase